jgi:hypothetical protein
MRRIRRGEALMCVGGVALFVLLFADWFKGGGVSRSGWSSLGWALDVLLAALFVMVVITVGSVLTRAKVAIAIGATVLTAVLAMVTLVIALLRVLIFQPDLDLGLGNEAVTVQVAGYLGLVALALVAVGGWMAIADERTGAPDSAYTPPPPRPVPGS